VKHAADPRFFFFFQVPFPRSHCPKRFCFFPPQHLPGLSFSASTPLDYKYPSDSSLPGSENVSFTQATIFRLTLDTEYFPPFSWFFSLLLGSSLAPPLCLGPPPRTSDTFLFFYRLHFLGCFSLAALIFFRCPLRPLSFLSVEFLLTARFPRSPIQWSGVRYNHCPLFLRASILIFDIFYPLGFLTSSMLFQSFSSGEYSGTRFLSLKLLISYL